MLAVTQEPRRPKTRGKLYDVSVIIVSYNTHEILRRCLQDLKEAATGLSTEVIVVDNCSKDGSVEMLEREYPESIVVQSEVNLGFAGANNCGMHLARGRYIVLLNSDAFLRPDALRAAVEHMDREPEVGLGGARLIDQDGSWQPSPHAFPSPLNDFLILSGLASRFPRSRFFGGPECTWADPMKPAEVDWVTGAFAIIRAEVLALTGYFDEAFFLYYEEVDLCRRIKVLGYKVKYWPDVVAVHLGGESSKRIQNAVLTPFGSQVMLWSFRSKFLYYRKNHRAAALLVRAVDLCWHRLRILRNCFSNREECQRKAANSRTVIGVVKRAWADTRGGRLSPPRPW